MNNTEHTDHQETEESLGAYVVGGLDGAETTLVRKHLEQCEQCRRAVDELEGLHELLEAATLAQEPPPELEERVVSAILRSASAGVEAAPIVADAEGLPLRSPASRRRLLTTLSTLGAAAIVIVLIAIAVNNQISKDRPSAGQAGASPSIGAISPTPAFRLVAAGSQLSSTPENSPSERPPDSSVVPSLPPATPTVRDIGNSNSRGSYGALIPGGEIIPRRIGATWQCDITVWGLDPGQLYEVWFKQRTGVYSGGSFRVDSPGINTVTVSTGVGLDKVEEIMISVEPDDGNPAPSGKVVLRAEIVGVR